MNEAAGIHHARQRGRRMAARGARPADRPLPRIGYLSVGFGTADEVIE
jgi:hypothetical protein